MEDNKINNLPDELYSLEKLESLTLGRCKLSEISEKISQLLSLRSLDLFGNNLVKLPSCIVSLTGLEKLNLQFNSGLILTEAQKEWIEKLERKNGIEIDVDL